MEYNLIKIDQLPDGIIGENNPIMFGIGDKIYKTNASNLLNLNQGESITPRLVSLPILVTNSNFATVLNSVNITIEKNEIVLVRFNTLFGNRLSLDTFLLPLGAGVYNPLGSEISFNNLIPINQEPYDEEGSDTNTVTYTVATLAEINTAVVPFDFSDETKVYLVVLGGQLYQFTGSLGLYGSGELQMTMTDLLLLANSGSSDFVEKQFYAIKPITTETFTLTNDGSTTFLLDTPTFGGFNFSSANAVKLFNGKTFTLANFTDEPITLLDGFGGATIKFADEIIIPAGVSLRFFVQFVQTIIDDETIFLTYRLNLIGAVGGEFLPLSGGTMTGNIEIIVPLEEDFNPIISTDLSADSILKIGYQDDGVTAIIIEDNTLSQKTVLSFGGITQIDSDNTAINGFGFFENELRLITNLTNVPAYKGLQGEDYYAENYDDNTYVQKKYVDDQIAEAGGGGGGTTIHNELTGRDADDAHPISAITGLEDELENRQLLARVSDTATANFNLSSKTWNNREVFLVVDVNDITVTLDQAVDTVLIRKIGSKSITFVNGSGRTIAFLSGIDTAESNYVSVIIQSVGTVDLLQINEDVDLFVRKSDYFTIEVLASAFTGTPRKATVTLPNGGLGTTNYDILPQIYSAQNTWHIENKTGTSFDFVFQSGNAVTANVEFTIRKR